ncbi:MAG: aminoacyl-tRNA hydrolase [Actinomycetia bacterium]|nr:aminoacyl-tRNA hydrolase [Actinomycetes bacterium]
MLRAVSSCQPRLIVGLGNPGREYQDTRHNAGFLAVEALAAELGCANYWKTTGEAMFAEKRLDDGSKLVLAKPLSFMNLSGGPTKGLLKISGCSLDELLVVHDELDLPPGSLRLKFGGGHGGHNGLRSISGAIGQDYARLRFGIGRPPGRMDAAAFVLQPLRDDTLADFQAQVIAAVPVLISCVRDGLARAMNAHHGDHGTG